MCDTCIGIADVSLCEQVKDGERKKEKTGKKVKAAVLILGWLQG